MGVEEDSNCCRSNEEGDEEKQGHRESIEVSSDDVAATEMGQQCALPLL